MSEKKPILVIGGGIAGMSTALEAAEVGKRIIIVEKEAFLGGRVSRLNHYFPKMCPPYCGLEINFRRIKQNPNITCYTLSEVTDVSGSPGNMQATIKIKPRYINEKCTACGDCVEACSSERSDDFNYNLNKTKGVYLPHEMAFPYLYVIDKHACSDDDLKKIKEACKYDAVEPEMQEKEIKVDVSSVVLATGWQPYDASKIENLGYGTIPNIITNVIMERLAAPNGPTRGKIQRPSDQKEPKRVAFVQCAGSRDENHMPFCSAVCCLASLKQARYVREKIKDSKVTIFYIDVRAQGKFEDFYTATDEDPNIVLKKGKVAKVEQDASSGDIIVEAEDVLSGVKHREAVDMVVLATGMQPRGINGNLAKHFEIDENGFAWSKPGFHAAGCTKRPSDVARVVQDATGTALKAIQDSAAGQGA
jgi:quinone-modifying oxidoreductase subunit QmoA